MESVFGLVGKDFAIVAADTSILVHKTNEDKIMLLDSHKLMGASGETGDRSMDISTGPSLYFLDYIASLHKLDKAAFGYGAYFALSTMDRHCRRNMTVEEAIDFVDKCILEIRTRLVVAPPNCVIKIVDKNGLR